MVGLGRTELAITILGKDDVKSGKVYLNNKDITGRNTRQLVDEGLHYIDEDRFLNSIFSFIFLQISSTFYCNLRYFGIDLIIIEGFNALRHFLSRLKIGKPQSPTA